TTVKWYRTILGAAQRHFQRKFNLPLAMVGIDPLIDATGAEQENSADETNEAMAAFRDLAHEFGCVFFVDDHAGKDIDRGARGSSAKPAKADFILTLPEKVADPSIHRTMTVKKLRNLPDGWGVDLWFEQVEVEAANGELATNLAACWGSTKGPGEKQKGGRPPRQQLSALKVLEELAAAATLRP